MPTFTQQSGFELQCDLTPRWWPGTPISRRRVLIARVIELVAQHSPWVTAVGYDVRDNGFTARVVLPDCVTLQTMMQKREETLDRLDGLKP